MSGLSALSSLSLTHNRLRNIEGLEALTSLLHLNLEGNRLRCGGRRAGKGGGRRRAQHCASGPPARA